MIAGSTWHWSNVAMKFVSSQAQVAFGFVTYLSCDGIRRAVQTKSGAASFLLFIGIHLK